MSTFQEYQRRNHFTDAPIIFQRGVIDPELLRLSSSDTGYSPCVNHHPHALQGIYDTPRHLADINPQQKSRSSEQENTSDETFNVNADLDKENEAQMEQSNRIFRCEVCQHTYQGKNARSILRRHLKEKHQIETPRGTRWDNDPNRPKTDEERRQRMLQSKRKWAQKARAKKVAQKDREQVNDHENIETDVSDVSDTMNETRAAVQLLALKSSTLKETTDQSSSNTSIVENGSSEIQRMLHTFTLNPLTANEQDRSLTSQQNQRPQPILPRPNPIRLLTNSQRTIITLPPLPRPVTPIMSHRFNQVQRSSPCHYAYTQNQCHHYGTPTLLTEIV